MKMARQPIDIDSLAEAVRGNQRAGLARAITLVESTRDDTGPSRSSFY